MAYRHEKDRIIDYSRRDEIDLNPFEIIEINQNSLEYESKLIDTAERSPDHRNSVFLRYSVEHEVASKVQSQRAIVLGAIGELGSAATVALGEKDYNRYQMYPDVSLFDDATYPVVIKADVDGIIALGKALEAQKTGCGISETPLI